MDLRMSEHERERFLATERNGVLSVAEADGGVVASPVWYLYEPGGDITLHLTDPSLKLAAVQAAGRATIVRPRRWFTRDYGKGGERWDEIVGVEGASVAE